MPLAFQSRSHGTVAFGFFNIESDMLLLEQQFFFADRFCAAVVELASKGAASVPGWCIDDPGDIGDLGRAIRGEFLTGFIGATYERFPFPAAPEDFKQSPDGALGQVLAAELITPFARTAEIRLAWDRETGLVTLGGIAFDENGFAQLVAYVERGGYPRWRDEVRPRYVLDMVDRLRPLASPFAARV